MGAANSLEPLFSTEIVVAFITFVVGPVLVVLVTNRRSTARAEKEVDKKAKKLVEQSGVGSDEILDLFVSWASDQTGKAQAQVDSLRGEMETMSQRINLLERTVELLKQQNAMLKLQIRNLGGQPFVYPEPGEPPPG